MTNTLVPHNLPKARRGRWSRARAQPLPTAALSAGVGEREGEEGEREHQRCLPSYRFPARLVPGRGTASAPSLGLVARSRSERAWAARKGGAACRTTSQFYKEACVIGGQGVKDRQAPAAHPPIRMSSRPKGGWAGERAEASHCLMKKFVLLWDNGKRTFARSGGTTPPPGNPRSGQASTG